MLEDLNITKLASTASDAQPGQLKGVAELLRELGNRRVEMLEDLNITKLASTASKADSSEFGVVAELIRQLSSAARRSSKILIWPSWHQPLAKPIRRTLVLSPNFCAS